MGLIDRREDKINPAYPSIHVICIAFPWLLAITHAKTTDQKHPNCQRKLSKNVMIDLVAFSLSTQL